ncbi:MAG: FAD-dependent oxidoreductase [Thermodesulfobacteriota bacterium]
MSDKNKITRRQFFKDTAVVVGAGAAATAGFGSLTATPAAGAVVPENWDKEADVIVVGSGPTGLPAAIAAVENGVSVIVLEQGKEVGGCGVITAGLLNLQGGTRIQKLNNIQDSPELLFRRMSDYKERYNKRDDPAIRRAFCDANPGTLDWLEQRGVRFMETLMPWAGSGQPAAYHYIWWDKEGPGAAALKTTQGISSGSGLIKPLETFAKNKGVEILLEHKMTRIIREGGTTGRVLGVEVQAGGGKLYFKARKAVILGSGGWKGHKFLRKLFDSRLTEDLPASGEPFVNPDGSGIQAGLEVGSVLKSDMTVDLALFRRKFGTKHYNFPLNSPYGAPGLAIGGPRMADVIFVNKFGMRYVNEEDSPSLGTYSFFDASLSQEDHVLWTIFDDAAAKKHKWDANPPVTEEGSAFGAPTLAELAKLIHVPGDALAETVRKYNTCVDAGTDPDFGKPKNLLMSKIETPPFYAVWISLYVHDTCGGLAVNARSQVLDINGKVIPGLYAGGEAAGGLGVVGMPRAIITGRIAGENAAAEKPA